MPPLPQEATISTINANMRIVWMASSHTFAPGALWFPAMDIVMRIFFPLAVDSLSLASDGASRVRADAESDSSALIQVVVGQPALCCVLAPITVSVIRFERPSTSWCSCSSPIVQSSMLNESHRLNN
jgi:hypothetical protein